MRMGAAGMIASIMLACGGAVVAPSDAPAADTCRWNDVGWSEMTDEERAAWRTLGWTGQMWDSDDPATQAPSSSEEWRSLSERERSAARQLGYGPNAWDHERCRTR